MQVGFLQLCLCNSLLGQLCIQVMVIKFTKNVAEEDKEEEEEEERWKQKEKTK